MGFEHVNRKDDTYFLQVRTTKTGKPNYYFGRKLTGVPVDTLPDGYEIYENPKDGQVYLRKAKPTQILPIERETVEQGVRADIAHCIVEVEGDSLVVYLPGTQESDVEKLITLTEPPWLPSSTRWQAAKVENDAACGLLPHDAIRVGRCGTASLCRAPLVLPRFG